MNSRKNLKLGLLAGACALLLSGCAVRTQARAPQPQPPAGWSSAQQDTSIQTSPADLTQWWKTFRDPTLDSLIERASSGNIDLRIAEDRLREARAMTGNTFFTRLTPNIGTTGGYSDRNSTSSTAGQDFTSRDNSLFRSGFDASYELDFFGGARASVRAAESDAGAALQGVNSTLVSVTGEVARNYVDLRTYQERLEFTRKSVEAQKEILRLTELRRDAGLASDLDASRAKAQVETTSATIPSLESLVQRTMHAIAVLLGEQPGHLNSELSTPGWIPPASPEIPIGLPSDLLRRRPDIRQAEYQIQGSAARVGVAVSNLYPKFSLTSSVGRQSNALLDILSGAARLWSFGSSFSWGLLNYPATKANIQAAEAREAQSIAQYEKTVLTALKDVEDALTNYTKEKERQTSLAQALEANRKSLELATQRYEKGLSSFLDVLDAQRSVYSSEDALLQSRGTQSANVIGLYKALGGGW